MLEANKSRWFEKLFSIYNRNLLKRRFNSLQVSNLEEFKSIDKNFPSIIYANHSGWFDGLVLHLITQKLNLDFFIMMEEKQLKDLPLFRKLGAFSVVREKPREAVESINYAAKILNEGNERVLCIFPQGEILPNDTRPIKFYNGISRIIEKTKVCNVIPAAIRYEFLGNFKPEIFVSFGKNEIINEDELKNSKLLTDIFARNSENLLNELKSKIIFNDFTDFQNIL